MGIQLRNSVFLFAALVFFPWSEARRYHVGGKDGWIVDPHIRYNHWSDRTRFVVHDTLVFKYQKGEESVLLVTKDDYYNCNTKNPVDRWDDGATEVELHRSGAFFFITGEVERCHKGQRLIVVVLPWSPQSTISLTPESPVDEPPSASPASGAVSPKSPPPTSATPANPPIQSPPSPPTTTAPSPAFIVQAPAPTPTPTEATVPAPVGSSASAITGRLALGVAAVAILFSAVFS